MEKVSAIVGSALFFALAPGVLAGLIPYLFWGWQQHAPLLGLSWLRGLGIALILIGAPILVDSFARFALQGLGTPAPVAPTRHLVVTGLYRYVRNPMYLAVAAVIFGQGFYLGRAGLLIYGAGFLLVCHLFVVGYEEPTLRRTFGDEYEAFCANVRRWLPRLKPWTGSRSA